MKSFALRRAVNISVTALMALILLAAWSIGQRSLRPHGFLTGWVLLGLIVFLALYNGRKALPFLPLGSSATWLQLHIYGGLLSFVIFAIHVGFSLPRGLFEICLASLYVTVFASGLVGLYITRTYPRRLTHLGQEVIFEHIPVARRQLQDDVQALVLGGASESGPSAIPEFYRDRIRPFLSGQHDVLSHLIRGSSGHWRTLKRAMADQNRYLSHDERDVMTRLQMLVDRKHQLDTQYALQGALKVWLFLHIPATYALLVFAFFHSVLVHAWSGGLP